MASKRPKKRKDRNVLEIKRPIGTAADGKTIRRSFYGTTLEEAEQQWQEYLNPPPLNLDVKPGTFAHVFLVHVLPLKAHLRKNSIDDLQNTARQLLPELGHIQCRQITFVEIAAVLTRIAAKMVLKNPHAKDREKNPEKWEPISARTVNKCRRMALEVMDVAAELDSRVRPITVGAAKRIPVRKETAKEFTIYNPSQMRRLLMACKGRTCEPAVLLYLCCGLRLNEGLGAWRSDLTPGGVLNVVRQDDGEGNITNLLKTDPSKRSLPLPPGLLEELRSFSFGKPGERIVRGMEVRRGDSTIGGKRLQESNLTRSLEACMKRAGIPFASPHDMRHCFSTWLDQNGCPRSTRLALLGQSTRSVEDRYNHASEESKQLWLGNLWTAIRSADPGEAIPEPAIGGTKSPNLGERNGRAQLTTDQVREIRSLKGKQSRGSVATQFGVSPKTVRNIQERRSWRHVS